MQAACQCCSAFASAAAACSCAPPPLLPLPLPLSPALPQNLDFDFEKCCSVTLSGHNVYACLVCGKYFQVRPAASSLLPP